MNRWWIVHGFTHIYVEYVTVEYVVGMCFV